jgi:hypothetical protein
MIAMIANANDSKSIAEMACRFLPSSFLLSKTNFNEPF